jgi:hypothetical protein
LHFAVKRALLTCAIQEIFEGLLPGIEMFQLVVGQTKVERKSLISRREKGSIQESNHVSRASCFALAVGLTRKAMLYAQLFEKLFQWLHATGFHILVAALNARNGLIVVLLLPLEIIRASSLVTSAKRIAGTHVSTNKSRSLS